MSFEARSAAANGEVVLALQSQSRVESMLPAMKSIAGYWPSAEAIDNIFRKLSAEIKEQTRSYFSRLELIRDEFATAGVETTSSSENVTESALWDASFNGSLAAGWSNIFGIGDANSFENFESLGPMDSWLTMSTESHRFSG